MSADRTQESKKHWEKHPRYKSGDAPSARAFADPKLERVCRKLGLTGSETVLDVGAGTGHLSAAWTRRGHPVTALDWADAMILRNPAPRRLRGDAARLPFADNSFDVVAEASLLHHVPDPVAVLQEMARVASGPIVVVEPNRNHPPMFLFSLLLREEWPALRFTAGHVRRLAKQAGLVEQSLETSGWVYQNKTPSALAGWLGRWDTPCPGAAYIVGAFEER